MKKVIVNLVFCLGVFLLIVVNQFSASAHVPPVNGATDCGLISGDKFYSDYYSPPEGTPAVNGSCSWVLQGTGNCGTRSYGGTTYTVYNYKWVCNMPLDSDIYYLMAGVIIFGCYMLNKDKFSSKKEIALS